MSKEPCPECAILKDKLSAAIEALAICQAKQTVEVPHKGTIGKRTQKGKDQ